ncbi:unnamed protein product, partial [Callosobruchus maculatus]
MLSRVAKRLETVTHKIEKYVRFSSNLVQGEPEGPYVRTELPGPKCKQIHNDLERIMDKA